MSIGEGERLETDQPPAGADGGQADDLARRVGELDAIYRLADAVARAETIDAVFAAALDALQQAVGVERASVVLFGADGAINFGSWRGISETYRRRLEGQAPWGTRAADPTPFVVDDVLADDEVAEFHEAFRDEGIRSMVLVPLVHAGAVLGRFVLYGDRPGSLPPQDVQLVETMASHVAAAAHRRRTEAAVRASRNQLEAIFRSVADGITAQAPDGSLVFANEAAARFSGFDTLEEFISTPAAEILARFEILDEDDRPLPVEELPGRVALVEGRECERLVQYRIRATGERRWSLVRATPVHDETGRVTLAINVFHDLSEQRRSGERLRVLADAGRTLASSLAVDETLAEIARLVVPAVADYCLVDLLGDDGSLRHVAHVHADPEGGRTLDELRRRYPVLGNPAHPVARVVATREPHVQLEQPEDELDDIALDEDHRELYRRLGPSSFLAVPLVARGRTLGAISLGTSSATGRRLDRDDLSLALELAERAALAVDNAILYQEAQAEVAERQRTEERLRALGRASEALASSLDYEETLRRVAELVVPSFADWCIVYEQRADGTIRRLAVEHAGGRAEEVREILDRFPLDPEAEHGVPAVVRTGIPELVEDETAERLTRDVDDPGGLMALLGDVTPRSSIRVPLIARGRTIGAIALLAAESGRSYGPDDLAFASELARRAAVAVDNARLFRETTESFARLDTFLGAAQVGLAFVDTELRFVQVNEWMATVNGVPVAAHIGRRPSEIAPELSALEPRFQRVLESRKPIIGLQLEGSGGRYLHASYYPVRDPDGELLGVGALVRDVTAEKREQIRSELRTTAGEALSATLDVDATLGELAELAVRGFADGCSVFLVDRGARELARVAVANADPARRALYERFPDRFPLDADPPAPIVAVAHDQEPRLVPSVGEALVEDLVAVGVDADALERIDVRSLMIVPLRSRSRALGVLTFTSTRPGHFGEADLQTATEVARRAAIAVDNARLSAEASESLALLDAIFATAPAGLAFFDTDLRYVRVNEALAEINGVPAADHVGRRVNEVLPEMDPRVESDLLRAIETREAIRAEVTGATPALPGEDRTWLVDYYPVVTPDGRTLGLGAVVVEITERKRAEARLRESEERFRQLADTIPALVWLSDTTGACTYFNRRWLEFTGRTMDEELGDGWYDHVHPDDLEPVRAADAASLRDQGPLTVEYRLRRHDGVHRWMLDEGLPRFTPEGEFAGHIGACIDIDDRRRVEGRQRFLAEASTGLAASLDVDRALDALARLAVPEIADWCSIVLAEEDGSLRAVTVAHSDPEKTRWARELQERLPTDPDAPRGAANVIRTGEPELLEDIPDELLVEALADEPELLTIVRELGLRSSLAVPLVARGRAIGALTLVTDGRSGRRFGEEDVAFAQDVARRAAVAVDNARLFHALESQSRLTATITDTAASALFLMDAKGRTTYMNPAAVELTGWTLDEVRDRRLHDVFHHSHPDGSPYPFEDCPISGTLLGGGEIRGHEDFHFRRDGSMFPIRCSATPILADGVVQGALLEILDITEERRVRAEADARAQAAQALEFVGDGVFLVDVEGVVRLWNRAAEAITGIDHHAAVGVPVVDVLPGWAELSAQVPVAGAELTTTRPQTLPFEIAEREHWLSISGVAYPHGTVYAFRDLTEEYAVERLKSDFVSTISHELRTPLAAIYGAAMTLQRTDVALADDQRTSLLDVVAGESERLARIVNDVLWASRLDSGVLDVAIESCDAGALATAVVAAARVHLPQSIELALHVEDGTPPVEADPDKVRQVLVNLVDNAIKYSPDGGLVEVRVEPMEHTVRFTVSDRGLGIPAAEHARVFEKFFRLDPNLTRGVGGTGLGLYICRELVRRMDGRIWVDSEEGAGSVFAFELPTAPL